MLNEQFAHISTLLEQKDWTTIREVIATLPEPEIAELLFEVGTTDRMILFRLLPRDISGEVFALLEGQQQNTLSNSLLRKNRGGC